LTVNYGKGEQTIMVPASAPVVTLAPADRTTLVSGAPLVVFARKGTDGMLTAGAVAVGKNGLVRRRCSRLQ